MTIVGRSSGSLLLPLPLPLRVGTGVTVVVALGEGLVGNHHEGTSPLSLTPEGPTPADWPITSMLPHTGHLVRFPACWSSALNLRPQVHETEIIATNSGWARLAFAGLRRRAREETLALSPPTLRTEYNPVKAPCGILHYRSCRLSVVSVGRASAA